MKIQSCRFERSAFKPEDEPKFPGPEVVFLGRSNVGKSSLINRLLGVRGLAKTSSTPGRTQSVNFYRVNDAWYLVDLPGYGYAKVPESVRRAWGPLVEGYLRRRRNRIALALLVVDARRDPGELDLTMRDWLEHEKIDYRMAVTKSDKLSGNARAKARARWARAAGEGREALLVSSQDGTGIKELWRHLDERLEGARSEG